MSTKATQHALAILDAHGKFDGSESARTAVRAAEVELAALRRVARAIVAADWMLGPGPAWDEASALMSNLAKEEER